MRTSTRKSSRTKTTEFSVIHVRCAGRHVRPASLEPAFLLGAMRAGVSEVVADPGLTEHLVSAVSRVAARQLRAAAGRVFAFVGAKGGVGTTTLAVNVASALGRSGTRVLLVDVHEGDGDAATFLNAQPIRTLGDACQNVHRLDERFLRGIVTQAGGGLDLLAAPDATGAHVIDAVPFRAVMQRAAATYPCVIIDASPRHVPLLESVESLTRLFIVTNQEFVSLKRGRRLADGLKSWCRDGRLSAVVNRFDDHGEIGERDVERVLGIGVTHTVPDDYARVCAAVGRGRPVVCADRSELGDALTALAARLSGTSSEAGYAAPPRPGFLQRLARAG